jgi:hypothetical protein
MIYNDKLEGFFVIGGKETVMSNGASVNMEVRFLNSFYYFSLLGLVWIKINSD